MVSDELNAQVEKSVQQMSAAAVAKNDPAESAVLAEQALSTATEAANQLAAAYAEQALTSRRRGLGKISSFLGADLGATMLDNKTASQFLIAFNSANVPIRWREVEAVEGRYDWSVCDKQIQWCRSHDLHVIAGPILLMDSHALPDWLALWEDDFENLIRFFSDYIRTVVERLRGKVDLWQCAGRVNTGEVLSLTEEKRLQLTARAIEIVRDCDPNT